MKRPAQALAIITLTASATGVSANHIDYFSDGGFGTTGTSIVTQLLNPGNVLGGERRISVNGEMKLPLAPGPGLVAGPNPAISLEYQGGGSDIGPGFSLLYDGIGDEGLDPSSVFGGIDFTGGGIWNSVAVRISAVNTAAPEGLRVSIFLTDGDGDFDASTLLIASSGILSFFHADFEPVIDFDRIKVVGFGFRPFDPDDTFALGQITREFTPPVVAQIPEPAGLSLFLAGLLDLIGMAGRRRPQFEFMKDYDHRRWSRGAKIAILAR